MLPIHQSKDIELTREFYQAVCRYSPNSYQLDSPLSALSQLKRKLTNNIDLLFQDPVSKLNLLHVAVQRGDCELLKWLHEQLGELAGYLWQKPAFVKINTDRKLEGSMTPTELAKTMYSKLYYDQAVALDQSENTNLSKELRARTAINELGSVIN